MSILKRVDDNRARGLEDVGKPQNDWERTGSFQSTRGARSRHFELDHAYGSRRTRLVCCSPNFRPP